MRTFIEWLCHAGLLDQLTLIENYYTYDQAAYNRLFQTQLEELLARITDPAHRAALESMRTMDWVSYIAASIRGAGFKDQREVQERTHDIVTKLLVGTLFRGYDETTSGPMPQRFRAAVTNAVKNLRSKEFNRRKYLPSVPITNEFQPGSVTHDEDREVVENFRRLVRERLGELALSVLDARLAGQETQSLIGREELGRPDKNRLKKAVQQVKALAREYAMTTGDQGFLRDVDRAMGREQRTVDKRLMTTRQGRVGIEM
ncbi:MAG: hypothetical protein ACYC4N_26760 [Pirellulaceae bacterium]